jgi:hypothetical protein
MPRDFKSRPTVNGAQIGLLSEAGAGISGTYSFAPTASIERHRITDSNVLTNSYILGELRRPVVAEVDDYGWEYDANVVEVGAGYFDIEVETSVLGELADQEFLDENDYILSRAGMVPFAGSGNLAIGIISSFTYAAQPFRVNTKSKISGFGVYFNITGNPTDNLVAYIQRATVVGAGLSPSGTILDSKEFNPVWGTVSSPNFYVVPFSNAILIPDVYFIVFHRTGSLDGSNYWTIETLTSISSSDEVRTTNNPTNNPGDTWAHTSDEGAMYKAYLKGINPSFLETLNYDYSVI